MYQLKYNLMMVILFTGLLSFQNLESLKANEMPGENDINVLTDEEKKNGWELLFDGKSIDHWRGYNMNEVPDCWVIEGNSLKIDNEGGAEHSTGLISKKSYKDFVLSIEFKLTKGANSGILYQVIEDKKYKHAYETGPEFQVIDHDAWPDALEDWQICGANYAMYSPLVKPYKPVGEWNQVVLIVNRDHVCQIMNGEVVVTYEKYSEEWKKLRNSGKWNKFPDYGTVDIGHIVLQNHGTQVFYRNIKIKEL